MGRFLFFLLLPFPLVAQFTYTIDQSIPVKSEGKTLANAWAGGLNAAQVSTMDLNGQINKKKGYLLFVVILFMKAQGLPKIFFCLFLLSEFIIGHSSIPQ